MSKAKTKKYLVREKPTDAVREELKEYPELVQELLGVRNIVTKQAAEDFFTPDYERDVHDPFKLRDMDKAIDRILKAIEDNEYIAIYSDFDCDGIPGGSLLHDLFKKIGYERFTNYIPHRDEEGYGFHVSAVDKLAKENVTLIITVDVGIMGNAAVDHATEIGVDVIITDHHIPGEELPKALAVVNPQRTDETYPFKYLCGTGVAYKLAQALLMRARETKKEWVEDIPLGWEKWLLDLVAIATVADMVSLTGENRALVHFGLTVLRKSRRPGIAALCKKVGAQLAYLTEDEIGFSIGPRINAASRMGNPELGFRLLTTTDVGEATDVARELESLNNKRKGSVASIVRELHARFEEDSSDAVLVAGNPKWNPALLGLAANSFVDTYGKTTCLWGREGTGSLKGSCRGDGYVNVVEMFHSSSDSLEQFGGHKHAGGFAVKNESVHTLGKTFSEAYLELTKDVTEEPEYIDAELPLSDLRRMHTTLMKFAPFGIENPKPIFVCNRVVVRSLNQFGKEKNHFEMHITKDESAATQRTIGFFKTPESFTCIPKLGESVDVLCTLELSRFAGRVRLELRVVDIR